LRKIRMSIENDSGKDCGLNRRRIEAFFVTNSICHFGFHRDFSCFLLHLNFNHLRILPLLESLLEESNVMILR